jgi:dGTPase
VSVGMAAPRSAYACDPDRSRGRLFDEPPSKTRSPFRRDCDRVIHSTAFRRLKHKTQVFVFHEGDHYRTRLTHTLEVAQIARALARQLGLDEDLTETLALAHDLGHPPFGHAGERALDACLEHHGGFDHNAQTLRIVASLEHRYPEFDGLNLTWESLEGIVKHNGPLTTRDGTALGRYRARGVPSGILDYLATYDLELCSFASLEAQVAAIADDIAYDNHDIDDGLRAGLLSLDQLLAVPMIAARWDQCRARFPDVPPSRLTGELIRGQIGGMVNDLIETSRAAIAESGIKEPDDARDIGRALVGFSERMREDERGLKRFMYASLYHHPLQVAAADKAHDVVAGLFAAYHADPALMAGEWPERLPPEEPWLSRHIADFIAGMTDRYAIARYREVVGPIDLPEGF